MTHGWPSSVMELLEVVGPLTDPTFAAWEEPQLFAEEVRAAFRSLR